MTTFNISLGIDNNRTQMNLTNEGFKDLRHDALTFTDADAAQEAFDSLDAAALISDGFKGYHVAEIWLTAHTVDAADEVCSKVVAEKKITVDTGA